jgi:hypothetical protein
MKRILREPLVHFLAIGALMFVVYAVVSHRNSSNGGTIEVRQGEIDMMTAVFERTWQRTPTPDEVKSLIDDYVRDEVLYREGLAMGLDREDPLIRRRMRQKVEFLAESINGIPETSDAALQAYLDAHRDRFVSPARVTFRQVYLGTAPATDTTRLLARLDKLGDSDAAAEVGLPTQLDARMVSVPPADVERTFGRKFAQALATIPVGAWHGPVASDYGVHLVSVTKRVEAHAPALDEVREQVKRDWLRDELAAANERYYASLRAKYVVRIESPRVALAP